MKVIRFLAVGMTLALAACNKPAATDKPVAAPAAPTKPPLVTVNDKPISNELYDHYVRALTEGKQSVSDLSAEDRETVRERLVRMELVAQQAEKDGLASDPDLAARIELARLNILQAASAQKYFKEHPPTDAELRSEFETQIASMPLVEYHARHIVVSGEDVARKVIEQLNRGTAFDELAKRLSTDKNSAVRGGDLGWFPPNRMPPSFADAIALLKKGEYTKTPVQSPIGWHVVQLLGTRDRPPPTFEASQDQIKDIVLSKKFMAYAEGLEKTAKIDPPLASAAAAAPAAPTAPGAPAAPAPEEPATSTPAPAPAPAPAPTN
jgi:peptidyl-prolyl cis-trans isomerase C